MNPLAIILGYVGKAIQTYISDWQASRDNKRQIEKAVADNKIRLAQSTTEFNQAWEMAALQGKDDTLRRASFIIWVMPLIWGLIDPKSVHDYFANLLAIFPDWYVYGFLAMNAAIWGITSLKNVRGALLSAPIASSDGKSE